MKTSAIPRAFLAVTWCYRGYTVTQEAYYPSRFVVTDVGARLHTCTWAEDAKDFIDTRLDSPSVSVSVSVSVPQPKE